MGPSEQALLNNPPAHANGTGLLHFERFRLDVPAIPPFDGDSDLQVDSPHLSFEVKPLTRSDSDRFRQVMQAGIDQSLHQRPMGEIVQTIAEQFLGSPYVANLLDRTPQETLVVNLMQFDCVLFVETVLALSRGIAVQDYSYQAFTDRLQEQRYRQGKLDGYCSRLHYFSEWVVDNEARQIVQNLTAELGGTSFNKLLNFMSQHRTHYPRLSADNTVYQCIQAMEARLNPLKVNFIASENIRQTYPQLQSGDIVAIATHVPGLDVTHTGLVYRHPDGRLGLIHAVPSGAVKISPDLDSYVQQVEDQVGILVARPLDPRSQQP